MSTITIIGGTGYAGSHLLKEAHDRGHTVISISRTLPGEQIDGVTYRSADVRDDQTLIDATRGTDVVISALSPRGALEGPGRLRGIIDALATHAVENSVRLGVIGGAGSLRVSEDGPLLIDSEGFPDAAKPEAGELAGVLELLKETDPRLDWFFVSPAESFGSFNPGEHTGTYRIGGDVVLRDAAGVSALSGADLADAVITEVEVPTHHRRRFTVAY